MREATALQGTAVLPQVCASSQSWKVWQQIPLETIRRNATCIEILADEELPLWRCSGRVIANSHVHVFPELTLTEEETARGPAEVSFIPASSVCRLGRRVQRLHRNPPQRHHG